MCDVCKDICEFLQVYLDNSATEVCVCMCVCMCVSVGLSGECECE